MTKCSGIRRSSRSNIKRMEKNMKEHVPNGIYEKYIKRPQDCIVASIALVALSTVFAGTSLLVKSKLGSPVFFTQDRPGKDEKIFKLYKFRTMTNKTDEEGNLLPDEQRLTAFGRFLRKSSLDELPELINIIKGDMSFVGPRPLLTRYLSYYYPEERARHSVRPGLTGLAQVNGRNNVSWENRFKMDVEYANNITFKGDVDIILKTIQKVISRSDISMGTELEMQDLDVERG